MGYSPERKEAVLKKMLPPNPRSIVQLAKEEGISEATLYNWRTQARNTGRLMPDSDCSPQGWTSKDKLAAVVETAPLNEAEIAMYCREKGLFVEQIVQWREACEQANNWTESTEKQLKTATKEDRKKLQRLEKQLARKDKALAEAAALLVLGKKLDAMYEDHEDD